MLIGEVENCPGPYAGRPEFEVVHPSFTGAGGAVLFGLLRPRIEGVEAWLRRAGRTPHRHADAVPVDPFDIVVGNDGERCGNLGRIGPGVVACVVPGAVQTVAWPRCWRCRFQHFERN